MFDLLAKVTQPGETMTVRYQRREDGQVHLIVEPRLDGTPPATDDDDATQARAALQRVVVFKGTHTSVVESFEGYVRGAGDHRASLHDAYRTLTQDTAAAAKKAASAAAAKNTSGRQAAPAAGSDSDKASAASAAAADTGVGASRGPGQPANLFDQNPNQKG